MTYYIVECPVEEDQKKATLLPYEGSPENWFAGRRFAKTPEVPIELLWAPENESEVRVSFYDTIPPVLMTKDLIAAIRQAGVDNLDDYPVVVRSSQGGKECHDFVAVNIIGVVAATDMDNSEVADMRSGIVDIAFDSLAIDESKAEGQLLFRLAESVTAIVMHKDVVEHLRSQGGFGLTFVDPSDFVAL